MERYISCNLICMPAPVPVSWNGEEEEAAEFNPLDVAEYFFKEARDYFTEQGGGNYNMTVIIISWFFLLARHSYGTHCQL